MNSKALVIFIATGLCYTARSGAAVQHTPQDSVQYDSFADVGQLLRPIEPTYSKGVMVASPWVGNWFVTLQGRAGAFIGSPIGCALT